MVSKGKYGFILMVALLISIAALAQNIKPNYAEMVNATIGSKGKGFGETERYLEAGYTFPGAMYPFGMVQFTTTFFDENKGFVVNQLSGAGCHNMGNFPTLPMAGTLQTSPKDMMTLKPEPKITKSVAGYYTATVAGDINCELSVTKRTGMAKFTFPANSSKGTVIIGSGVNATTVSDASIKITSNNSCEGYADGGNFCGIPTPYKVYFVAEFDVKAATVGTWEQDKLTVGNTTATGANSGAYFTFDAVGGKPVQYKFAISYVSIENARENLKAENSSWNFEAVKNGAQTVWNNFLGKIEVSGGSGDAMTQFYSHLYHVLAHPSLFSDVNGQYLGSDNAVHQTEANHDFYTGFSNWDTYRTQIQLIALLAPKETSDIIRSTLTFAQQSGGGFPRWVMANIETGIMQGDPTAIVVANAYAFGAKDFNTKQALEIMRRGAEKPGTKSQNEETRPFLQQYIDKGYMNASMQLEYTSADFAIGQFALQSMQGKGLYQKYLQRSQSWKNLFDPSTNWLRSRSPDGSWKKQDEDWREANYQNYFWMIPYNLKDLIDTIGGKKYAEQRLDTFFRKLNANYGQPWFAAGNEPDFQVPWTYNWTGQPYKTQALVQRILKEQYSNRASGLPGNDDLGAMGGFYVFASIGLFPMIPGYAGFSINSPSFQNIKLHLVNGKEISITGGSESKPYITAMKLNGKPYNSTWLDWKQLINGATMIYTTSSTPNKTWGTAVAPLSFK